MTFVWTPGPFLAAALAVSVLVWTALERRRQRAALGRMQVQFGPDSQLARMLSSASYRRHYLGRGSLACAVALLVLAASGPQIPGHSTGQRFGIDVVVAMDYSTSMLADDVYPDRLEASKRAVEKLLDSAPNNRVGLVVFAGGAAHFPLTHDRRALRTMFRGLEVSDLPPGSNLAEAIRVGRCLVRPGRLDDPGCGGVGGRGRGGAPLGGEATEGAVRAGDDRSVHSAAGANKERGRALIIFTDGEETDGDAREELALATRLGIEVYMVGVGTVAGAKVPELDPRGYRLGWKRRADGGDVESKLELGALTELADVAGGAERLFTIGSPGRSPSQLTSALAALQRAVWRAQSVRRHRDIYEWFLFPAFLLLIVESTMSTRRRPVPELVAR